MVGSIFAKLIVHVVNQMNGFGETPNPHYLENFWGLRPQTPGGGCAPCTPTSAGAQSRRPAWLAGGGLGFTPSASPVAVRKRTLSLRSRFLALLLRFASLAV